MTFTEFDSHNGDVVNFFRKGDIPVISHFSYEICNYIERKTQLEREEKLQELGL